jgi:hypothetical protein
MVRCVSADVSALRAAIPVYRALQRVDGALPADSRRWIPLITSVGALLRARPSTAGGPHGVRVLSAIRPRGLPTGGGAAPGRIQPWRRRAPCLYRTERNPRNRSTGPSLGGSSIAPPSVRTKAVASHLVANGQSRKGDAAVRKLQTRVSVLGSGSRM